MPVRSPKWLYATLAALNAALFLPAFLTAPEPRDALPFMPHVDDALSYAHALVVQRANPDVFRVSLEFVLLLLLTAAWREQRWLSWAAGVAYATVVTFLGYHFAYARIWRAEPALWDDVTLLPSFLGYLSYATSRTVAALAMVGCVVVIGSLAWGAARAFLAWQRAVTSRAVRALAVIALVCLVSLAWFGASAEAPVWRLPSKVVIDNVRASLLRRKRVAELRALRVDRRAAETHRVQLTRKPRVYVLMIEAYGQRLATDPELQAPFRELTTRVDDRLSSMGYRSRSAFSESPVYGGKSWLSVATVQTGVRIDTPSLFDEVVAEGTQLATLTSFFKSQGYRTSACLPGNYRTDLGPDPYGPDVVLDNEALHYEGQRVGYVGVPDQFSLRAYRARVLSDDWQPQFAFFLSISTHHPYPALAFEGGPDWSLIDTSRVTSPQHAAYFRSVEYEWRTLLEFIAADASDDAVFFLIGDHQPVLDGNSARERDDARRQQSSFTPVHVVSRNHAFVERFAAYGFTPGLFAEPGAGQLKHEGLQSLFLHEFVGEYGGPEQQRFTRYQPRGVEPASR